MQESIQDLNETIQKIDETPAASAETLAASTEEHNKPKKRRKKLVFVLAGVVVLVLAAAAFTVLKGSRSGPKNAGEMPAGMGAQQPGGNPSAGALNGGQKPSGNGAPSGAAPGGAGASAGGSYTVVKTEEPHIGDVSVTSSLSGNVEASDVIYLYAKASGDVTSIDVAAGQDVEAGQLLLTINTDQVASAQNQLSSAEITLNSAKADLNRMQILFDGGDITRQEMESYQNKLKSAQLAFESAQLNYDKQVSYSEITAPISGHVESINVDVYDRVNNNAELLVISGRGEQRITTYVTERMVHNIRIGDPVKIFKNGKEYSGSVTEVNTMVDASTGLFKVKAELENTDEIATGSAVKIVLTTDRAEGAVLVPVDAIYYSGGDAYLYVVEEGVAYMRPVEVGLYDSEVAEIRSGVEMTDKVIATWSSNIYEGARVRLFDELEGKS